MTPAARREYVRALRPRYTLAPRRAKPGILNEFCATTGHNRKYAIAVPNCPVCPPKTSPRRLLASGVGEPAELRALQRLRTRLDPFVLAATIDRKLQAIYRLANRRHSPRGSAPSARASRPNPATGTTIGCSSPAPTAAAALGPGEKLNDATIPCSIRFFDELTGGDRTRDPFDQNRPKIEAAFTNRMKGCGNSPIRTVAATDTASTVRERDVSGMAGAPSGGAICHIARTTPT